MNIHKFLYSLTKPILGLLICLIFLPISGFSMLELDTEKNQLQATTACDFEAKILIERSPECDDLGGVVSIWVTGNEAPVTYFWKVDGGEMFSTGTVNTLEHIPANITHWAIIRDTSGCEIILDFELAKQPCSCEFSDLAAVAEIHQQPECGKKGAVSIIATGGVAPYKYSWGEETRYDNLVSGVYQVIVTDAVGCITEVDFELNPLENCCTDPNFNAEVVIHQQPDCGETNGSVTINATGGVAPYHYSWGGESSYDNLVPGNYTVTVTDAFGCPIVVDFTLVQEDCCTDSDLAAVAIINQHPECGKNNGTVSLEVTGGQAPYGYSWGAESSYDNLIPGKYVVTITDDLDCSTVAVFTLIEGPCCPNFLVEFAIKDPTNCDQNDGTVDFTIIGSTGDLTYTWEDGLISTDSFRTNLSDKTYQVTITDEGSGCLQIIRLPLKTFAPCLECDLTIGAEVSPPSCNGNDGKICMVAISSSDTISYLWEDGTIADCREGLAAGIYKVTVSDGVCEKDTMITIIKDCIECNLMIETEVINENCVGSDGKICLNVTGNIGAISYLWEDGTTAVCREGLAAGTYKVIVSDGVCEKDTMITIIKDCPCDLSIGAEVSPPSCNENDGKICMLAISSSDTISYLWEDGTTAVCREGLAAGTYKVTVSDGVCEKDTMIILTNSMSEVIITPDTLCSDTTIGGLNYDLMGCIMLPINIQILDTLNQVVRTINKDDLGSERIELLLPNLPYTFIATDANGQEIHRQEFRIIIPVKPSYELFPKDTVLCDAVTLTEIGIDLMGEASFFWSSTPNLEDTLSRKAILEVPIGSYYIALDVGCITMDSVEVKDGRIAVDLLNPDPLCMPGRTTLNVLNLKPMQTLSFNWTPKELITSPTDTTDSPEVNISETTQFNVLINNQFGCELMDAVTVMVFDTNLLADIRVLPNPEKIAATTFSELSLSGTPLPDGFTFEWQQDPTLEDRGATAIVTPVVNGTRYFATIFADAAPQCAVTRDTAIWIGCDDNALFIPNVFSPNGDGINDVLYVRGADGLESMNIIIYNRWGEQVFESSDPEFGWNGYFKGKELGPDVYGYYLTINCPIGGRTLKGNVTLLK